MAAFEVQWNESETHLKRIGEDGLDARITALVGEEFMPAIRDRHAAFDALGLGDAPVESKEAVAISGAIAELAIAIAEYGRILSGELDRKDPASIDAFKKAMASVDRHRTWLASMRTGATKEEVESEEDVIGEDDSVNPAEPVPPLPTP